MRFAASKGAPDLHLVLSRESRQVMRQNCILGCEELRWKMAASGGITHLGHLAIFRLYSLNRLDSATVSNETQASVSWLCVPRSIAARASSQHDSIQDDRGWPYERPDTAEQPDQKNCLDAFHETKKSWPLSRATIDTSIRTRELSATYALI